MGAARPGDPALRALRRPPAGRDGGPVAVVSHGTVLSLYLGLSFEEWEAIELPAVAVVDPRARRIVTTFVGVDAFLALY